MKTLAPLLLLTLGCAGDPSVDDPTDADTDAEADTDTDTDTDTDADTDTDTDTDADTDADTDTDTDADANRLLVDGVLVDLDGYQAYTYTAPYANLATYDADWAREILVQTRQEVGSHPCSLSSGVSINYVELDNGNLYFSSDHPGGSCTIEVDQVDATTFRGTYSGVVTTQDGATQRVLTEGVFGTIE